MEDFNKVQFRGDYIMYLNLVHRRLVVDDNYRLVNTPPQKKVYPTSGCFLSYCTCPLSTCNRCAHSYNFLEL